MQYRMHFTDAALRQLDALGLDQDRVRTAIHAGTKLQRSEHANIVRHRGIEVAYDDEGADYTITLVRREPEGPRRGLEHPYLQSLRGPA